MKYQKAQSFKKLGNISPGFPNTKHSYIDRFYLKKNKEEGKYICLWLHL